jgi:hypothetical protein
VRLVVVDGEGVPTFGNIVFVVDPEAVLHRVASGRPHAPTTQPLELFTDPLLAERFLSDLEALRAVLGPGPAAASASSRSGAAVTSSLSSDGDGWERYLDECAGRVGNALLRFAVGLPPDAGAPLQDLLSVSWDDEATNDVEAALEGDDAESVAADHDPVMADADVTATTLPDLRKADEEVRRRYRRVVERMVPPAPQWSREKGRTVTPGPRRGPVDSLLVVRLTLWIIAAGAWPPRHAGWVPLLSRAVLALAPSDHQAGFPEKFEPQISSLAAVALAVLRSHAPRYETTPETAAFNEASRAVRHLLPAMDAAYVAEYTRLLDRGSGPSVHEAAVLDVASDVLQDDPLADAMWSLTEKGREVHRDGPLLLHAPGSFTNPALVALQAVGAAEDAPLVGAWAGSSGGAWALVVWRRPDLIVVDAKGTAPLWKHHRLTGLVGPRALASQPNPGSAPSVFHGPRNRPFELAQQVLLELGLTGPLPPRCES